MNQSQELRLTLNINILYIPQERTNLFWLNKFQIRPKRYYNMTSSEWYYDSPKVR